MAADKPKPPRPPSARKKQVFRESCPICAGRGSYKAGGEAVTCHGCHGFKAVNLNKHAEKAIKAASKAKGVKHGG